MSVRLSDDEAWAYVEAGHTGVMTSVRRDGWPISLPVWFVVIDRKVHISTPAKSKKVARVRRDERACFLVEDGLNWKDLNAVMIPVRATIVENEAVADAIMSAMHAKYAGFRTPSENLPTATRNHYAGSPP